MTSCQIKLGPWFKFRYIWVGHQIKEKKVMQISEFKSSDIAYNWMQHVGIISNSKQQIPTFHFR